MSPLQTIQLKPSITQGFGVNPQLYKQFGFLGHEGIDLRAYVGTAVFAPIEGVVTVKDSGKAGYGLHIIITNDRFKIVLAHLSEVFVKTGDFVPLLNKIAKSGNSGNSQAPHLHMTVVRMKDGEVQDLNNGYAGAVDVTDYIVTWKGSLTKDLIS